MVIDNYNLCNIYDVLNSFLLGVKMEIGINYTKADLKLLDSLE